MKDIYPSDFLNYHFKYAEQMLNLIEHTGQFKTDDNNLPIEIAHNAHRAKAYYYSICMHHISSISNVVSKEVNFKKDVSESTRNNLVEETKNIILSLSALFQPAKFGWTVELTQTENIKFRINKLAKDLKLVIQ